jgi:tetratricopeptide (TPR) repeat protein
MAAPLLDGHRDTDAALLVEELIDRLQADGSDVDDYIAAHPEHADTLRRLLPAARILADLSRSVDGAHAVFGDTGALLGELGDFRLLREVGRGGMGVVYEAEQVSLGRRVALKVLPYAATIDPRQLQRFHNEARAAASLHHEHIVPVYAVGCERGVHYYAMQFIDGRTLADVIQDLRGGPASASAGPQTATVAWGPSRESVASVRSAADTAPVAALSTQVGRKDKAHYRWIAELMAQAADALEHAHVVGVVHRDVKPGNLLVDDAGKLWVADFGLARLGTDAGLTMSGDLLGTLRYMSPEQALSRQGLVDHRADVYGLGCTLYELLSGRPAVDATDRAAILRQIAFEDPTPPRKLHRSIPAELETITLKALAKNPNDRYAAAADLADDLRRWLADQTIKAKPPSLRQKAAKWLRRHRALAWSAAAAVLVAVVALAASVGYVASDRAARRARAEERVREAVELAEVRLVDGDPYAVDLVAALHKLDAHLDSGLVGDDLQRHARRVAEDRAMLVALEQARMQGSTVTGNHFDWTGEAAAYARAFQKYGVDALGLDPDLAATRVRDRHIAVHLAVALDDWAMCLREDGKQSESKHLLEVARRSDRDDWRERLREALLSGTGNRLPELARQAPVNELPSTTLSLLGKALCGRKMYAEAVDLLIRAQRLHPTDVWLNHDVALALLNVRPPRREAAIGFLRAAVALRPISPGISLNLGMALIANGQPDEAIEAYNQAVRLKPDYSAAHNNLGWALRQQKKWTEARAHLEKAILLNPAYAEAYAGVGTVLLDQGHVAEAIEKCREAIRHKPKLAEAHCNLGIALGKQGKFAESIAALREAIRLKPDYAEAHCNLGHALQNQRKLDEAIACYQESIRLNPDDAIAHYNFGNILREQNKREAAVASYREAVRLKPDYSEAHCNLGYTLAMQGKLADAIVAHGEAIRLEPGLANAHVGLGNALREQNKLEAAVASYREAVRLEPGLAVAHFNLGIVLAAQGKLDDAIVSWRETVRHKPDFLDAHFNQGVALQMRGKFGDAIAAYREAVRLNPDEPMAQNNFAWILATCPDARLRHAAWAVEHARNAVKQMPDNSGFWNTLGVAQYRTGDWKAAVEALTKATQLAKGGSATDFLFLAMAEWQLGNKDAARNWYEKAVAWMDKNKAKDDDLRRFRAEAAELLGIPAGKAEVRPPSGND